MTERLAYSVNETAIILGVSAHTIRRMVYDGILPAKRLGAKNSQQPRVIIPAKALEEWISRPDEAPGVAAKRRNARVAAAAREKLRAI